MTESEEGGRDQAEPGDETAQAADEHGSRHGIGSRLKGITLLATAVAAVLGLAAATQTWFDFTLHTASGDGADVVHVAGTTAASALTALSLAGLALTAALAIAGRVARLLLGALGVVLAASIGYSTIAALSDPIGSGGSAVTTKTGIAGAASIDRLVAHTTVTVWPALALVAAVLLLLASLAALTAGHRWPSASKKYRAVRFEPATGAPDDARDSAAPHPDAAAPDRHPEDDTAEDPDAEAARRRDHAIDTWDELSRGDDPTAGA